MDQSSNYSLICDQKCRMEEAVTIKTEVMVVFCVLVVMGNKWEYIKLCFNLIQTKLMWLMQNVSPEGG